MILKSKILLREYKIEYRKNTKNIIIHLGVNRTENLKFLNAYLSNTTTY